MSRRPKERRRLSLSCNNIKQSLFLTCVSLASHDHPPSVGLSLLFPLIALARHSRRAPVSSILPILSSLSPLHRVPRRQNIRTSLGIVGPCRIRSWPDYCAAQFTRNVSIVVMWRWSCSAHSLSPQSRLFFIRQLHFIQTAK